MAVSADLVKHLRQLTGASVALCKKALEETKGDMERALGELKKSAEAHAAKKSERTAKAGVVEAYVHAGGKIGVLMELKCETDFVARTDEFKTLAHDIALHIAGMNPAYITQDRAPEGTFGEALMSQPYVKDQNITVGELIAKASARFGEKLEVTRFVRYEL